MNIIVLRLVSMQSATEINLCFIHQYMHKLVVYKAFDCGIKAIQRGKPWGNGTCNIILCICVHLDDYKTY